MFPHLDRTSVSRIVLLSNHANIRTYFGIREILSLSSPFSCTFILFQKSFYVLIREFSQRKTGGHFFFFKKHVDFLVFFLLAFFLSINFFQAKFFLEKVCNPGKVGNRDYILSKGIQGVRMKIHKTPLFFWRFRQTIAKYIRQYARSSKISQTEITNN